jgi:hypothetical protein
MIGSIKGKVKKKNFSRGWNFSTFAAHLIGTDPAIEQIGT